MNIKKHGTGSVSIVSHMNKPARKIPDKPGIDSSEYKLALIGLFPCTVHIIKYPGYLARGKISIRNKSRLLDDHVCSSGRNDLIDHRSGPSALPDYRIIYRLTRFPVPHDGGFSLVGDTDGSDIGSIQIHVGHGFSCNGKLG